MSDGNHVWTTAYMLVQRENISNATDPACQWHSERVSSITFILLFILGVPIIMTGIVTSLLSVMMFQRDRFTPSTTKLMLQLLAVIDVIFLACAIYYVEFKLIFTHFDGPVPLTLKQWRENPNVEIPISFIINTCELLRNWLTVLIGIERFLVTRFPLQSARLFTMKRLLASIFVILLCVLLLRAPFLLRRITANKTEEHLKALSELSKRIHTIIDSLFLTLIPVCVLIVLSVGIMKAMRLSMALSRMPGIGQASSAFRRKVKVTRMLTTVLIVFSLAGLPFVCLSVMELVLDKTCSLLSLLTALCWFTSMSYSMSNFFIYIVCLPKYRHILAAMFTCDSRPQSQLYFENQRLVRPAAMMEEDLNNDRNSKQQPLLPAVLDGMSDKHTINQSL